jgi:hypothetical protein
MHVQGCATRGQPHAIMDAYFRCHIEEGLTGDLGERPNARSSVKLIQALISAWVCSGPRGTIFEDDRY